MRTIDAASYLQAKLADLLKKYPADSVSKREVVYTLPFDQSAEIELAAAELDQKLTATIYRQAAEMWDSMPPISNFAALNPFKYDPSREEQIKRAELLTAAIMTTCQSLSQC